MHTTWTYTYRQSYHTYTYTHMHEYMHTHKHKHIHFCTHIPTHKEYFNPKSQAGICYDFFYYKVAHNWQIMHWKIIVSVLLWDCNTLVCESKITISCIFHNAKYKIIWLFFSMVGIHIFPKTYIGPTKNRNYLYLPPQSWSAKITYQWI